MPPLELLNKARLLPKQDELDRVRLELLAKLAAAKRLLIASDDEPDSTTAFMQSIVVRELRVPQTFKNLLKEKVFENPDVASPILESFIAVMEPVTRAEPTSQSLGVLAFFLRLRLRIRPDPNLAVRLIKVLDQARGHGDLSPENLSLRSDSWALIWRETQDRRAFGRAVVSAAEAASAGKNWAWPLVRLAELTDEAKRHGDPFSGGWTVSAGGEQAGRAFVELVNDQNTGELLRLAAERTVAALHLDKRVLGGRSEAFVVDDIHGLLEHQFVLKPTDTQRERSTSRGRPKKWLLSSNLVICREG